MFLLFCRRFGFQIVVQNGDEKKNYVHRGVRWIIKWVPAMVTMATMERVPAMVTAQQRMAMQVEVHHHRQFHLEHRAYHLILDLTACTLLYLSQ